MSIEKARLLARHVTSLIGSRPVIRAYLNPTETQKVSVASFEGWPSAELCAALTVDLVTTPMGLAPEEYELLAVAGSQWGQLPNIVADAGLRYRSGDIPWAPGAIYHDGVLPYYPGLEVRHLIAVNPLMEVLAIAGPPEMQPPVRWLQLLPITQSELDFLELSGLESLLAAVERSGADVADLGRPGSVERT